MADNVKYDAPSTGTNIAFDEIGSVLHQRVKMEHGVDGSASDVSDAAPMPISLGVTKTASGWLQSLAIDVKAVFKTASGTSARLGGVIAANLDTQTVWLQMFNVVSPIVGTTTPNLTIPIPPGDGSNIYGQVEITFDPAEFGTAITYAVTTTPTGNTAPTNNAVVNVFYKA